MCIHVYLEYKCSCASYISVLAMRGLRKMYILSFMEKGKGMSMLELVKW